MIQLDALKSPVLRHAFFTREGGVSDGLFTSLNFSAADKAENVTENRKRAMTMIGAAADGLVTAKQVHGTETIIVDKPWARDQQPKADALATNVPGITLGVLSADCVPVLFADPTAKIIAAAHAGWRGALSGVVESAVSAMEELGAHAPRIVAAIGPSISQTSYEVGPEFPRQFLARDPANAAFFVPAPKTGHFLFDIKGYVARRLTALGIGRVAMSPADTAAEPDHFFSYRRACLKGELGHGLGMSAISLIR